MDLSDMDSAQEVVVNQYNATDYAGLRDLCAKGARDTVPGRSQNAEILVAKYDDQIVGALIPGDHAKSVELVVLSSFANKGVEEKLLKHPSHHP